MSERLSLRPRLEARRSQEPKPPYATPPRRSASAKRTPALPPHVLVSVVKETASNEYFMWFRLTRRQVYAADVIFLEAKYYAAKTHHYR